MAPNEQRRELIDDLDVLLASLPPEIVAAVHRLDDAENLIEVVLDLGRRPEARFPDSEETLLDREIAESDIDYVVDHIGSFGDDNHHTVSSGDSLEYLSDDGHYDGWANDHGQRSGR